MNLTQEKLMQYHGESAIRIRALEEQNFVLSEKAKRLEAELEKLRKELQPAQNKEVGK